MREGFSMIGVAVAGLAIGIAAFVSPSSAQTPAASPQAAAPKTPWGDPDLQGIWTDETDTPLQRSPKYANQEFFTDAERADLDRQRANMQGRERRAERGSIADVAGAYNDAFTPKKRTGLRTSRIVDPPNGRLPPQTPDAQKGGAAERAFRVGLLQATETCKNKETPCAGGKYDATPSPQYSAPPPRYNTATINRYDGPEDASLAVRCLMGGLPEVGTLGAIADRISFRRIVQTPGGIAMFYDVGQGQGWQRNIVMDGSRHVPASIRQWYGDSRGRWEGNTLVIDVTNFSPKNRFPGVAGEPAHRRALDAHRAEFTRIRRDRRGPDGVGAAMDREAGVHQTERRGESNLQRAALHRRKLRSPRIASRTSDAGTRFCRGTRSRSEDDHLRLG
jgi:hypothetical protein